MPSRRIIKVCPINFWDKAFRNDFFHYLLNLATDGSVEYVNTIEGADIVFSSIFGKTPSPREKTILYVGENVRPNFLTCRYSLSFDTDPWGGANCFLPFWYSRLAWPGFSYVNEREDGINTHGYEELIPIDALLRPRKAPSNLVSRRFCCSVAGNPEPLRLNLYMALNQYKKVDGYGKLFNKPLFASKFDILRNYKFCLCPENSYFKSYITEKVFDAWHGGTIPIWYGPNEAACGLNTSAFLNYATHLNISALIKDVIRLDSNHEDYLQTYAQQLLTKAPEIEPVVHFLASAIQTIMAST